MPLKYSITTAKSAFKYSISFDQNYEKIMIRQNFKWKFKSYSESITHFIALQRFLIRYKPHIYRQD